MSRRIVVLAFALFLLVGANGMLAPSQASADLGWTTFVRHCWTITHDGSRLRACTSVRGGLVDDQVMIRSRCRVKMLNFEPTFIRMTCLLKDQSFHTISSAQKQRSGVTALIVKTPLRPCVASRMYYGSSDFTFYYPDGSIGSYGLATDLVTPCPAPTSAGGSSSGDHVARDP
jgi:hypothetical protein